MKYMKLFEGEKIKPRFKRYEYVKLISFPEIRGPYHLMGDYEGKFFQVYSLTRSVGPNYFGYEYWLKGLNCPSIGWIKDEYIAPLEEHELAANKYNL